MTGDRAANETIPEHARRVLIIDDDRDFADSLSKLLTLEGYKTARVYGAPDAMAAIDEFAAEVALIDIRLGERSGIELIAAFRERRPDVICVMITAYASAETAIQALQEGAYDYLCKPFFTEDLLATLDRCFERLSLARERDAAEATLRRRNAQLERVNAQLHRMMHSMQRISACTGLRDLMAVILDEVAGNVGADGGAFYLKRDGQLVLGQMVGEGYPPTLSAAALYSGEIPVAMRTMPPCGASTTDAGQVPGDVPGRLMAFPLTADHRQPVGALLLRSENGLSRRDQELGLILASFGGEAVRILQGLEELASSEERLRKIIDNTPSAISLRDLAGRYVVVNRRFEKWHGVGGDAMAGRTAHELFPAELARLYSARDEEVLLSRAAVDHEVELPLSDGSTHIALLTTFPVLDGAGEPMGVGSIATDLSGRRRAEEALRQAQKMEALGQLTGGIAHDFNNLLAVVLGNLGLLEEQVEGDGEVLELVQDALESARGGVDLTHRLLAFGRRQRLHPQVTDPAQMLSGMSRLLQRTLGETIEIRRSLPARLRHIRVDRNQLETTLLNLAINARDAMPGGGILTIEAGNLDNAAERAGTHGTILPGRYVTIAVTDTGCGMPAGVVEQALQPFFTTKDVGQGSGLGLSMAYGFVKQSGGNISITSEPGEGATVTLYLPATQAEAREAAPKMPDVLDTEGRGETILVVEDRPDVRKLARRILSRLGYEVLEAADGPAALAVLGDGPDVDLLFTDIVLPGRMSGLRLAREARDRNPGLKVLYTSGYAPSTIAEQDGWDGDIQLVNKPFRRDELAAVVRSTLDAAPV